MSLLVKYLQSAKEELTILNILSALIDREVQLILGSSIPLVICIQIHIDQRAVT